VLDQAGYESQNQNAFLNLQFLAGARTEVFATTMYSSGKATVKNFVYDSSNIIPGTALPAGALDIRRILRPRLPDHHPDHRRELPGVEQRHHQLDPVVRRPERREAVSL
jgi:hypothetical protein